MRPMTEEEFNAAQKRPMTEEEFNAAKKEPSLFDKAMDYINKPQVSPEEVGSGLAAMATPYGSKDAMTLGLSKPEEGPKETPTDPLYQGITGSTNSLEGLASGMTEPKNIGLLGLGAVSPIAGAIAAASPSIPGLFKNGVSELGNSGIGGMVKGGYQGIKSGLENIGSGDYEKAGENLTSGGANALMAAGLGKGLYDVGKGVVAPENPYDKAVSPEVQKMAQENYPLKTGEITQRALPRMIEKALRMTPMTAQIMADSDVAQLNALKGAEESYLDKIGRTNPEEVGADVREGLRAKNDEFQNTSKSLYDDVRESAGTATGNPNNLEKGLRKQISDIESLPENHRDTGLLKNLKGKLQDVSPSTIESEDAPPESTPKEFDFNTLSALKKKYNELKRGEFDPLKSTQSPEYSVYEKLEANAKKDIADFAKKSGNNTDQKYANADTYYAKGHKLLNGDEATTLRDLAENNKSAIADNMIQGNKYEQVQRAKELLGDKFDSVKKQFAKNNLDSAESEKIGQIEPAARGLALKKVLGKYSPEVLNETFKPDELKATNDLANKMAVSESAMRAGTIPVRGGPLSQLFHKYIMGLPSKLVAPIMLNPKMIQLMSTSLPEPGIGKIAYPLSNELEKKNKERQNEKR